MGTYLLLDKYDFRYIYCIYILYVYLYIYIYNNNDIYVYLLDCANFLGTGDYYAAKRRVTTKILAKPGKTIHLLCQPRHAMLCVAPHDTTLPGSYFVVLVILHIRTHPNWIWVKLGEVSNRSTITGVCVCLFLTSFFRALHLVGWSGDGKPFCIEDGNSHSLYPMGGGVMLFRFRKGGERWGKVD